MRSVSACVLPLFAAVGFLVASPIASAGAKSSTGLPRNATSVYNIQSAYIWNMVDDSGTSGVATGTMSLVSTPSLSGYARDFGISYQNSAGERYWAIFGNDPSATNFLYDTYVYIASPSSDIANLEFDMNQVMSNGQTVIFAVQCDGYSSTWDYTTNAGTPASPIDQWLHSTAHCNPQSWSTNQWHHLQISYSRDSVGNVTYKYVTLDGVQNKINETVPSAFALGWSSVLLTNFQIDGLGGYGSATVYLDKLTISRW